ncbi:MAG: hypothetical protein J0L77_04225 [Alphaproteobacteria bacterium]|nr:hypothetical protein [Alphaproteobacteria bacterium]
MSDTKKHNPSQSDVVGRLQDEFEAGSNVLSCGDELPLPEVTEMDWAFWEKNRANGAAVVVTVAEVERGRVYAHDGSYLFSPK